jgi:hypothetical protein
MEYTCYSIFQMVLLLHTTIFVSLKLKNVANKILNKMCISCDGKFTHYKRNLFYEIPKFELYLRMN